MAKHLNNLKKSEIKVRYNDGWTQVELSKMYGNHNLQFLEFLEKLLKGGIVRGKTLMEESLN
jgi:hypothetical protein